MSELSSSFTGIFLLSLPRAGSTMLRLILDTHPEIWSPDEIRLGELAAALFHCAEGLAELPGREWAHSPNLEASPEALQRTRRVIHELIDDYLQRKGKTVWCEKSPQNLHYLEVLDRVFPAARYILLHRHPFDIIASWLDSCRYGILFDFLREDLLANPANYLLGMTQSWVRHTERLLRWEAQYPARCLRLRYEDVVCDPVATSRSLSGLLGLEFDPRFVATAFSTPHHQRTNYAGDINAFLSSELSTVRIGRGNDLPWKRLSALPEDLLARVNRLLEELGYPAIDFSSPGYETGVAPRRNEPSMHSEASVRALFEEVLPQRLRSDAAPMDGAGVYEIAVTGEEESIWQVDLARRPGRVVAGGGGADCRIEISSAVLRELVSGRMNPGIAFRQGKVKVHGRIGLAEIRQLLALLSGGSISEPLEREA
jgi:hypothetical protein